MYIKIAAKFFSLFPFILASFPAPLLWFCSSLWSRLHRSNSSDVLYKNVLKNSRRHFPLFLCSLFPAPLLWFCCSLWSRLHDSNSLDEQHPRSNSGAYRCYGAVH